MEMVRHQTVGQDIDERDPLILEHIFLPDLTRPQAWSPAIVLNIEQSQKMFIISGLMEYRSFTRSAVVDVVIHVSFGVSLRAKPGAAWGGTWSEALSLAPGSVRNRTPSL